MEPQDILQKIIDEEGSCSWVLDMDFKDNICNKCPLSKLRRNDTDTHWLSCQEAIIGNINFNGNIKQMNKLFLIAAKNTLMDILIEELFLK